MNPNLSLLPKRIRCFFRNSSKEATEPDMLTLFLFIFWILFSAFFVVMFFFEFGTVGATFSRFLGIQDTAQSTAKFQILKFLGVAMGGTLVALQALASYRRSKAMEDTANAQVEANAHTERGQRQERLRNAIEHLGNNSESVRMGGAYELFNLAQDTPTLRQVVLNILCAHIRMKTAGSAYRNSFPNQPSGEMQSLLNILFREGHRDFAGLRADLRYSWLNGAVLREAILTRAILTGVYLRGAVLFLARLEGVALNHAKLQGANLWLAQLQGADLWGAGMQATNLSWAKLQGANLWKAQFQGAGLSGVELQGAAGGPAGLAMTASEKTFSDRMMEGVDQEPDLSEVTFEGGLTRADLDEYITGLSNEDARKLREKLKPHVNRLPSSRLPENSGAVSEAYTEKEAAECIGKYEKTMHEAGFCDA